MRRLYTFLPADITQTFGWGNNGLDTGPKTAHVRDVVALTEGRVATICDAIAGVDGALCLVLEALRQPVAATPAIVLPSQLKKRGRPKKQ